MKTQIMFSGALILTFLLIACSPSQKTVAEKKIVTKENLLEGLHIPDVKFGFPSGFLRKDIPVYTEDAVEITRDEMDKMIKSNEYLSVPYVNDKNEMTLWLVRSATEQERMTRKDFENKQLNLPNLKGKPAIAFTATDLNGKKYSLEALKGKIVVINFWFIGCKPCIMEMDDLNTLVDKCKGKEVVFMGFTTDKKDMLVDFLKKKTFKYVIIPDSKEICNSYNTHVFPANLIIDQHSMITYHSIGLNENVLSEMFAEIERLEKK